MHAAAPKPDILETPATARQIRNGVGVSPAAHEDALELLRRLGFVKTGKVPSRKRAARKMAKRPSHK